MSDNRNVVEVPETEDLRGEKIGQEKRPSIVTLLLAGL